MNDSTFSEKKDDREDDQLLSEFQKQAQRKKNGDDRDPAFLLYFQHDNKVVRVIWLPKNGQERWRENIQGKYFLVTQGHYNKLLHFILYLCEIIENIQNW